MRSAELELAISRALKLAIDRDRRPGRFLLTGSANALFVPKLSDSLAGRMEILRLFPLAQCEMERTPGHFLDALYEAKFSLRRSPMLGAELIRRVLAGGFPAAVARPPGRRRQAWYRSYIETLMQRDIRDLAELRGLEAMPKLLEAAAGQTARLVNFTDLASPFQLSRPTIQEYVTLLERIFALDFLQPWHTNRLSRLVKTPKLHLGDTGLAGALLGVDEAALAEDRALLGQLLESFVYGELRRQASWHEASFKFHHFRDRDGFEVDLVLEKQGRELAGVEVKASGTVGEKDFRGLAKLRDAIGKRFTAGVVLYDGEHALPFGDRLFAVPVRILWE